MFENVPPTTLAYIAGLMDGEGTITIRRVASRGRREQYTPHVSIAQKEREILDWVKETLGVGTVLKKTFKDGVGFSAGRGPRYMHHWTSTYNQAYQVAAILRPYLRIKHRQANIVIELQSMKIPQGLRWEKGQRGPSATPPWLIEKYRDLAAQVQALNGRASPGVGPRFEAASANPISLECAACQSAFTSDTYFSQHQLENHKHYCKACRESGAAAKDISRRANERATAARRAKKAHSA